MEKLRLIKSCLESQFSKENFYLEQAFREDFWKRWLFKPGLVRGIEVEHVEMVLAFQALHSSSS